MLMNWFCFVSNGNAQVDRLLLRLMRRRDELLLLATGPRGPGDEDDEGDGRLIDSL